MNPLTRKLELFGPLPEPDRLLLDKVVAVSPMRLRAHQDVIRDGDTPSHVNLVLAGVACRYKILSTGERQLFAFLIAGDFCDLNVFILRTMDHTIATLSECTVSAIPRASILELTERPAIARALWWATLVDEAVLREWIVNLGRRDAETGMAHLFCEMHLRFKSVGLGDEGGFDFPLTQTELADAMGMSTVHANRSMQSLRAHNLMTMRSGRVEIPSIERLRAMCGFNPNYLHLDGGK